MTFTTRDILEYASLDALGLLDEAEREEFERAFRAASPEVQAMVRREQTRAADIDSWLPRVEAPAGLKGRVVSAWRDAVAAVAPEPVGTIGPVMPQVNIGLRTGYIWRAACIGFATATLVLAGFFISSLQLNNDLRTQVGQNKAASEFSRFGPGFIQTFFAQNKREYQLVPQSQTFAPSVQARLIVTDDQGQGMLAFQRLPLDEGTYRVVLTSAKGEQQVVAFKATGGLTTVPIDLSKFGGATTANLDSLAILGPADKNATTESVIFRVKTA
jgi:hypothetical protein